MLIEIRWFTMQKKANPLKIRRPPMPSHFQAAIIMARAMEGRVTSRGGEWRE